jgi:hypothetical protein
LIAAVLQMPGEVPADETRTAQQGDTLYLHASTRCSGLCDVVSSAIVRLFAAPIVHCGAECLKRLCSVAPTHQEYLALVVAQDHASVTHLIAVAG